MAIDGEVVLYGLKDYDKVIDSLIEKLGYEQNNFAVKLVITEAVSNAFKHGNNCDSSIPIVVRYHCEDEIIRIDIQDSGQKQDEVYIPSELSEENLLSESGRGLFLIKSFCDDVEFKNNTLTITMNKNKTSEGERIDAI